MKPLVSVIIPSFNHARYIGEAIESVLSQSYENFELIVIDDGSKDNSVEVIKTFRDPRIVLLTHANIGAHATINRGLGLARGELLTILNSDDRFAPTRFETLVREFEQNPGLGMTCSYIRLIDIDGSESNLKRGWENLRPWYIPNVEKSFLGAPNFAAKLVCGNFVATTSNMMFTRAVYNDVGGMENLRFAHDWDFAFRVALRYPCSIVAEFLLDYRLHTTNTINSNQSWLNVEIASIWAKYLPLVVADLASGRTHAPMSAPEIVSRFIASANFQGLEPFVILVSCLNSAGHTMTLADNEALHAVIEANRDVKISFWGHGKVGRFLRKVKNKVVGTFRSPE